MPRTAPVTEISRSNSPFPVMGVSRDNFGVEIGVSRGNNAHIHLARAR